MAGALLCNRCQFCAARKIKCDEQWPTCGNCTRRQRKCSGPPSSRFVHTEWRQMSSLRSERAAGLSTSEPSSSSQKIRKWKVTTLPRAKCLFSSQKMPPWKVTIGPTPSNPVERTIAGLAECIISNEHVNFDAYLSKKSYDLLPRHMLTSEALADAVEFMIASYSNHRRGLLPREVFDFKLYGQALRSLNKALQSPHEQNGTSILAAVSILYRVTSAHDSGYGIHPSTHLRGVHAVMAAQGPPSFQNNLSLSLALDNFGPLYNESLLTGQPSIYSSPEWQSVISTALESGMVQDDEMVHSYILSLRASHWTSLVDKLRQAGQAECKPDALAIAADVVEMTMAEIRRIKDFDEWSLTRMRDQGMIAETPDISSPFPTSYTFSDPTAAQSFTYYASALIGLNRIAEMALNIAGLEDFSIEVAIVQLSHRIGGCISYIRNLRPLGCCGFMHPLQFAFESCDTKQQQFIIDAFYDFEEYKGLPSGRWTEYRILRYATVMTGRIPPEEHANMDLSF